MDRNEVLIEREYPGGDSFGVEARVIIDGLEIHNVRDYEVRDSAAVPGRYIPRFPVPADENEPRLVTISFWARAHIR